jgi:hypothetical protein
MTQREKLIDILMSKPYGHSSYEDFADYLLENGVRLPPCKAGDTVYYLDLRSLIIRELKVAEIIITTPHNAMLLNLSDGYLHGASDFGISLFYTREEAEKALAERRSNNATQQPDTE